LAGSPGVPLRSTQAKLSHPLRGLKPQESQRAAFANSSASVSHPSRVEARVVPTPLQARASRTSFPTRRFKRLLQEWQIVLNGEPHRVLILLCERNLGSIEHNWGFRRRAAPVGLGGVRPHRSPGHRPGLSYGGHVVAEDNGDGLTPGKAQGDGSTPPSPEGTDLCQPRPPAWGNRPNIHQPPAPTGRHDNGVRTIWEASRTNGRGRKKPCNH
jgi:hypothetical protein